MPNKFVSLFSQLNLENEFSKFPLKHVSTFSLLKVFISALKATFASNKPSVRTGTHYIFDCSNETKFKAVKPYFEILEKSSLILISQNEGDRGQRFQNQISQGSYSYILFPSLIADFGILSVLLSEILQTKSINPRKLNFLINCYSVLYKYYYLMNRSEVEFLITTNDDSYLNTAINKLMKVLKVKTINVMHGRGYLNDHTYDYSILTGNSQIEFLKNKTSSHSKFLICDSPYQKKKPIPKILDKSVIRNLIFFDQPDFELYPKATRDRVLNDLKTLAKELPEIKLYVQPHPSSDEAFLSQIKSLGFTIGHLNERDYTLSISVCSTVGFESIYEYGMPIVYLNYSDVLENFSHVRIFKPVAVENYTTFKKLVTDVVNDPTLYSDYFSMQVSICEREFKDSLKSEQIIQVAFKDINGLHT